MNIGQLRLLKKKWNSKTQSINKKFSCFIYQFAVPLHHFYVFFVFITPSSHPPSINLFIAYSLYCCNEQSSMHHWVVLPFSGKQITTKSALENILSANSHNIDQPMHIHLHEYSDRTDTYIFHTHTHALEKKHYGWYQASIHLHTYWNKFLHINICMPSYTDNDTYRFTCSYLPTKSKSILHIHIVIYIFPRKNMYNPYWHIFKIILLKVIKNTYTYLNSLMKFIHLHTY